MASHNRSESRIPRRYRRIVHQPPVSVGGGGEREREREREREPQSSRGGPTLPHPDLQSRCGRKKHDSMGTGTRDRVGWFFCVSMCVCVCVSAHPRSNEGGLVLSLYASIGDRQAKSSRDRTRRYATASTTSPTPLMKAVRKKKLDDTVAADVQ